MKMMNSNKHLHEAIWSGEIRTVTSCLEKMKDVPVEINEKDEQGLRPLDIALMMNNEKIVKLLMETGKQSIVVDSTTFHYFIKVGDEKMIPYIIEHHCNAIMNSVNSFGETPLHQAAINGNEKFTNLFIKLGTSWHGDDEPCISINKKSINGFTPLHYAIMASNFQCTKVLLENHADITATTMDGSTALHLAVKRGDLNILHLLRYYKRDVIYDLNKVNRHSALLIAVMNNDECMVKALVKYGADTEYSMNGKNLLHIACELGHSALVDYFIEKGVIDRESISDNNLTALLIAIEKRREDVIHLLLKKKVKLNAKDHLGRNALHIAAQFCNAQIVQLLIKKGLDVKEVSHGQKSALHYAVLNDTFSTEVIEILVKNGAQVDKVDENGYTALQIVCKSTRSPDIMKKLLDNHADPSHMSYDGSTPLEVCFMNFCSEKLSILLKHGADPNKINNKGDGILHASVIHYGDYLPKVWSSEFVTEFGADVTQKNNDGLTPLQLCMEMCEGRTLKFAIEYLLKNGAEISKTKLGETLLHLAVKKNEIKLVNLLVEKKVQDLDDVTSDGSTVLHYAAKYSSAGIAEILLENGLLVGTRNNDGSTALHVAGARGCDEIVNLFFELIVNCRVGIDDKNEDGNTALALAVMGNHLKIVNVLMKNRASATIENKQGFTAYDLAEGKKEIYKCLLFHKT